MGNLPVYTTRLSNDWMVTFETILVGCAQTATVGWTNGGCRLFVVFCCAVAFVGLGIQVYVKFDGICFWWSAALSNHKIIPASIILNSLELPLLSQVVRDDVYDIRMSSKTDPAWHPKPCASVLDSRFSEWPLGARCGKTRYMWSDSGPRQGETPLLANPGPQPAENDALSKAAGFQRRGKTLFRVFTRVPQIEPYSKINTLLNFVDFQVRFWNVWN